MAFTKILGPGIHTLANFHSHNINSSGIITATKFVGPLGAGVTGDGANFSGIVTCTGLDVNGDGHVSGALTVTGNVNIGGTITYTDVTNIDAVGIITAQSGINISGNGLNVISGVSTFAGDIDANADIELAGNLAVTGVSTFTGYINLAQKIIHTGDADTSIEFDTNTIKFETAGSEALRITSAGNVGIGTDNPNQKLHISATNPIIKFTDIDTNQSSMIRGADGHLYLDTHDATRDIIFRSEFGSATEVARITGDGKVGIGTITPTSNLHVANYCGITRIISNM